MRFVATVFPLASPRHSRRPLPWQTLARAVVTTGVALAAALVSHGAVAQGFSVLVSPPRFELRAKPGETLREAVQLDNVSSQPATLKVGSADWRFDADAAIRFQDALAPGSCRPWLAIESHDLSLAANGKHRFRFQISVPADAPAGECRLALMFEGAPVDVKGAEITRKALENGDTIEEYRVAGQLRMVKVTPARGAPFYLYDRNGDGRMDGNKDGVSPVYWKLYSW